MLNEVVNPVWVGDLGTHVSAYVNLVDWANDVMGSCCASRDAGCMHMHFRHTKARVAEARGLASHRRARRWET